MGIKLQEVDLGKVFLDMKKVTKGKKIDELNFIKTKIFCASRTPLRK